MRAAGQIPVERASSTAVGAYDAAVAAVRAGECIVVYPEGTITRDPDLWPMVGKSGAARIALETGCPVIPVGQWGAQELLAPYAKKPDLFPRKTIHIVVGDPVDLVRPGRRGRAPPRCSPRRPTGSWTPSPPSSQASAASSRRPSASTRARPGSPRSATRTEQRPASKDAA